MFDPFLLVWVGRSKGVGVDKGPDPDLGTTLEQGVDPGRSRKPVSVHRSRRRSLWISYRSTHEEVRVRQTSLHLKIRDRSNVGPLGTSLGSSPHETRDFRTLSRDLLLLGLGTESSVRTEVRGR